MKAVLDGDCDLAVMTGDSLAGRLDYEELAADECVIVTSRNHPLNRSEGASLADVLSYPILCPDAFYSMRRVIQAHAAPRGLILQLAPEANGIKTTAAGLAMAAAGLGSYICCRSWIPREFLTHFNDCNIMRSFGIVTAQDQELGSAARRFRALLRTLKPTEDGWIVNPL
jgi:DNA-binding transcriptional LysR family regulator